MPDYAAWGPDESLYVTDYQQAVIWRVTPGGASNQIVELSPFGVEPGRFGQQLTGANNSSVPFDSPSGVAFDGTRLIIANQSYFAGSKASQALLALETEEPGATVFVPANSAAATQPAHRRHHSAGTTGVGTGTADPRPLGVARPHGRRAPARPKSGSFTILYEA